MADPDDDDIRDGCPSADAGAGVAPPVLIPLFLDSVKVKTCQQKAVRPDYEDMVVNKSPKTGILDWLIRRIICDSYRKSESYDIILTWLRKNSINELAINELAD